MSHSNFGKEVRVEQNGREVKLVFVASTQYQADAFAEDLVDQLRGGSIHLTLTGKPERVERVQ